MTGGRPLCLAGATGLVLPRADVYGRLLTNGEAGRRIAAAVTAGDREGALAMLRADPRLATTHVPPFGYDAGGSPPDGAYGNLLTFAVARCDEAMIDALIGAGVSPDAGAPGEAVALAFEADTPTMAARLLAGGASPNPERLAPRTRSLFTLAAIAGNVGAVRLLLHHKGDPDVPGPGGTTPLARALGVGGLRVAAVLHGAGASLWSANINGALPAHDLPVTTAELAPADVEAVTPMLAERDRASAPVPDQPTVLRLLRENRWPTPAFAAMGAKPPTAEMRELIAQNWADARRRGLD